LPPSPQPEGARAETENPSGERDRVQLERAARMSDTMIFVARAVLAEAGGGTPFHAGTEASRSGNHKSKRRAEKGFGEFEAQGQGNGVTSLPPAGSPGCAKTSDGCGENAKRKHRTAETQSKLKYAHQVGEISRDERKIKFGI
jgi:hypothetical protein